MAEYTRAFVAGAVLAVLSLGASSSVNAAAEFDHGSACQPATSTDAGKLEFGHWGVHNTSSTAANIVCNSHATGATFRALVTVYDRSSSANVTCTAKVTGVGGSPEFFSLTKSSSSNLPGAQSLDFPLPSSFGGVFHLECSIPASTSSGLSHVADYWVDYR